MKTHNLCTVPTALKDSWMELTITHNASAGDVVLCICTRCKRARDDSAIIMMPIVLERTLRYTCGEEEREWTRRTCLTRARPGSPMITFIIRLRPPCHSRMRRVIIRSAYTFASRALFAFPITTKHRRVRAHYYYYTTSQYTQISITGRPPACRDICCVYNTVCDSRRICAFRGLTRTTRAVFCVSRRENSSKIRREYAALRA